MVKLDGRSDLYSLGCTMYHLLSGQLPFKGESSMDCIVGRITGKAVPISEVVPGLPPRLVQAIEKLMATNPDDRYQTADEAAAALRSLLRPKNAAPSRSAPTVSGDRPVPKPSRTAVQPRRQQSRLDRTAVRGNGLRRDVQPLRPTSPPRPGRDSLVETEARIRFRHARPTVGRRPCRVLAAVAVTAISLIVITIILFKSSAGRKSGIAAGNVHTNNGPVPGGSYRVRKPSLISENPKQARRSVRVKPSPPQTPGGSQAFAGRVW